MHTLRDTAKSYVLGDRPPEVRLDRGRKLYEVYSSRVQKRYQVLLYSVPGMVSC